jgi:hypothetical protein
MTNFRKMMIAAAAMTMLGSQIHAAELAPLPTGKPAGVKEAQGSPNVLVAVGVAAVVVGGLAIALTNSGDSSCGAACNQPTNTTTSSTP